MESFIRKLAKTPEDYNQLLKQMFRRLNSIKNTILDLCLVRKNSTVLNQIKLKKKKLFKNLFEFFFFHYIKFYKIY